MRLLLSAVTLSLAGCASPPEPYPVEPQSVTVHFLSESEWYKHTTQMSLNGLTWGMPGDVRGSARWDTNDEGEITECEIYFPAGKAPTRHTLFHELKHCSDGAFHR